MICHKSDEDSIKKCVDALKNGEVVIIPTDTVYGFSGIVSSYNSNLVSKKINTDEKIRIIKGRSETKPFIQLISEPEDVYKYTNQKIPENLIEKWPGPLTMIVTLKDGINTVAFRCPCNEWLREIIRQCDAPLYSTSVNKSGCPILDTEKEIIAQFENDVSLIVLDGDKKESLPSTIIKIEENGYKLIRQGVLVL